MDLKKTSEVKIKVSTKIFSTPEPIVFSSKTWFWSQSNILCNIQLTREKERERENENNDMQNQRRTPSGW